MTCTCLFVRTVCYHSKLYGQTEMLASQSYQCSSTIQPCLRKSFQEAGVQPFSVGSNRAAQFTMNRAKVHMNFLLHVALSHIIHVLVYIPVTECGIRSFYVCPAEVTLYTYLLESQSMRLDKITSIKCHSDSDPASCKTAVPPLNGMQFSLIHLCVSCSDM